MRHVLGCTLALSITAMPLRADEKAWATAQDASFHLNTSWNGGVPQTNDVATHNLIGSYVVSHAANATNQQMKVIGHGTVTASLGNSTYTLTDGSSSLVIGVANGNQSRLTVLSGTIDAQRMKIGSELGSNGGGTVGSGGRLILHNTLEVKGAGTGFLFVTIGGQVDVNGIVNVAVNTAGGTGEITIDGGRFFQNSAVDTITVGANGVGTFNVYNGGTFGAAGEMVAGANSGAEGRVRFTGVNTSVNLASLVVGNFGKGDLRTGSDALVRVTNNVDFAARSGSTAEGVIDSRFEVGSLNIGGTSTQAGGTVTSLRFAANANVLVSGTLRTWTTGALQDAIGSCVSAFRFEGPIGSYLLTAGFLGVGTDVSVGSCPLANDEVFNSSKSMYVGGRFQVLTGSSFTLSGGILETERLGTGGGTINLGRGVLRVQSDHVILAGASSPFGVRATIGDGMLVDLAHSGRNYSVATDGVLEVLNGGRVKTANLLTNYGRTILRGDLAVIEAPDFTNKGILEGQGRFLNNLTLDEQGEVNVALGGYTPYLDYDVLHVLHAVHMAGKLNVASLGTFMPVQEFGFQIFPAGIYLGPGFDEINLFPLTNGGWWDTSRLLIDGKLFARFAPVPEPSTFLLLACASLGFAAMRVRPARAAVDGANDANLPNRNDVKRTG